MRKRTGKNKSTPLNTPALDMLTKEAEKEYGGKVMRKGVDLIPVSYIHTGIFAIDLALLGGFVDHQTSITVGWESASKTTLTFKLIANAQKKYPDKKAVFLDVETHFDKDWAEVHGVNLDKLIVVSDLGHGELYRDVLDGVLRTGEVSIVILDSIAALVPKDEIEKSAVDEVKIGARAKLVGRIYSTIIHAKQELNKIDKVDPLVVLINQWRNRIVFMGDPKCLHGDSLVNFVNGESIRIKDVVEKRIQGKVWGIDIDSNKVIPVNIIDHHFNGLAKEGELITTTVEGIETPNGITSLTSTKNHRHLTKNGWVRADNLNIGDKLLTKYENVINGGIRNFLNGALCGDSHLARNKNQKNSFIKFQDSVDKDYLKWKYQLLKESLGGNIDKRGVYSTNHLYSLTKYDNEYTGNRNPLRLLENFSWLGMTIWILDDAHLQNGRYYKLCIKRYKNQLDDVSKRFRKLGLTNSISSDGCYINFTAESSRRISKQISWFTPSCMSRKLLKNKAIGDNLSLNFERKYLTEEVKVINIELASPRKYRSKGLYDLSVSGDNAFLAGSSTNGFYTHNTLPGGNSQKFLSYLTFECKKGKPINPNKKKKEQMDLAKKDSTAIIAKNFGFKVHKTKSGMSRDSGEYEMVVSKQFPNLDVGDIDEIKFIVNTAKKYEFLTGGGAGQKILNYGDEKFSSMVDIAERLLSEPDELELLKAGIVAIARINNGKKAIPADGNLLGLDGKSIKDFINKLES